MATTVTKPRLTIRQKICIWDRIAEGYDEDFDRHPQTVITEDFKGNELSYLLKMAEYFGIALG